MGENLEAYIKQYSTLFGSLDHTVAKQLSCWVYKVKNEKGKNVVDGDFMRLHILQSSRGRKNYIVKKNMVYQGPTNIKETNTKIGETVRNKFKN